MSKKQQVRQVIEQIKPRMAEVVPSGCSVDRICNVVISEIQANNKLIDCSVGSIASAAMDCARLGMEPGSRLGHLYLIPRGGKVTVQIGYKGLIKMAQRNQRVKSIHAEVFYQSEIDEGLFKASKCPAKIEHEWRSGIDKSQMAGAWARVELTGGQVIQVILDKADIERRKGKAMGGGKTGPWKDDPEAMARKSAIKAVLTGGLVPLTGEDAIAIEEPDDPIQAPAPVLEEPLVLDVKPPSATERAMDAMT